ncbi:MAG: DUF4270 family protein [Muribaculaceae bacterium]|nr:DUF4270 family protein [Muribaculaceae bacterium]
MRNFIIVMASFAMLLATASCVDDTIGSSLLDSQTALIEDSSFTLTGSTIANHHLRSRSTKQLIGIVNSPGYGTLESDVVTQFMPALELEDDDVTVETIDSCRLSLYISTGDFTGDSIVPMRMTAYALTKSLPNPIYSDFDPTGYYDPSAPLGSATYSANALQQSDSVQSLGYRCVVIPLPVELARSMFEEYHNNPATFNSPTAFAQFFPGIYLTNTYGQGHVMNFKATQLDVYYHKASEPGTALAQVYMTATPEVVYNNNIKLTFDPAVQQMVDDGEALVMGPAGLEAQLRFPIQDIVDNYRARSKNGLAVINSLEFTLPVEEVENRWGVAPPTHLLLVKSAKKDEFFEADTLTDNKDSFYAEYDPVTQSYTFNDMRAYLLDILNNKNGVAADEDMFLTLTPIDVTTYTAQSSYYTTATTTVTKIAPAVSKPSIARILLKKAKIKLTFSRQFIE